MRTLSLVLLATMSIAHAQPGAHPPAPVAPADLPAATPSLTTVDEGSSIRTAGVITAGTGAALLGVSLGLALRARNKAAEVETFRGEWTTTQRMVETSGQRAQTWSVVTVVAGALLLVAGGGIYYFGATAPPRSVDLAITPDAAELSWSVAF